MQGALSLMGFEVPEIWAKILLLPAAIAGVDIWGSLINSITGMLIPEIIHG